MDFLKLQNLTNELQPFEGDYMVIGGHACALHYAEEGLSFRKTDDVDIVLVIDKWTEAFATVINEYVHRYSYKISQVKIPDSDKRIGYRFTVTDAYSEENCIPKEIELFSPMADGMRIGAETHLAVLPDFDSTSALGVILTDSTCYEFIIQSRVWIKGIPTVTRGCLIAIKSFAYLSNKQLLSDGILKPDQQFDVDKHILDACRLSTILQEPLPPLPERLQVSAKQAHYELVNGNEFDRLVVTYPLTKVSQTMVGLFKAAIYENNPQVFPITA